jgi:hypothetical protein
MSAGDVFGTEDMASLFYLHLSHMSFLPLGKLETLMLANSPNGQHDAWTYCWGENYTAAKFYDLIFLSYKGVQCLHMALKIKLYHENQNVCLAPSVGLS